MIIIANGVVLSVTGGKREYHALKPINDESGVERWIVDDVNYTVEIEGHKLRLRTREEIEADSRYALYVKNTLIDAASSQAITSFDTIPLWMKRTTADEAELWIDTNVTSLATAKTALKALARMLLIVRDFIKLHGND